MRADSGGPSVGVDSYGILTGLPPTSPVAVCLFEAEPRPVPLPPGVDTVANGVRVFALGPHAREIDAIGDVDRLSRQLDTLETGVG